VKKEVMEKYKRYRFLSQFLILFSNKKRKEILKAEHNFYLLYFFTTQEGLFKVWKKIPERCSISISHSFFFIIFSKTNLLDIKKSNGGEDKE